MGVTKKKGARKLWAGASIPLQGGKADFSGIDPMKGLTAGFGQAGLALAQREQEKAANGFASTSKAEVAIDGINGLAQAVPGMGGALATAGNMAGEFAESAIKDKGIGYGVSYKTQGEAGLSGALKGAGTGAAIGSMAGPIGGLIGAGVGAAAGGVAGLLGNKGAAGQAQEEKSKRMGQHTMQTGRESASLYARKGGVLPKKFTDGGVAEPPAQPTAMRRKGGVLPGKLSQGGAVAGVIPATDKNGIPLQKAEPHKPVAPAAREADIRPVSVAGSDGTVNRTHSGDESYIAAYHSGKLVGENDAGVLVAAKDLPEVTVRPGGEAPERFDYKGCVNGMCQDMAKANKLDYEEFRKLNNAYGDAWDFGNTAFKQDIYQQGQHDKLDYQQMRVNDVVNLTRQRFLSDPDKGIPESNQHIGRISKIVDGVPYVRHYIDDRYYEEPIDNIAEHTRYQPSRVYRLDQFKEIDYNNEDKPAAFNPKYKYNEQEKAILEVMNGQRQDLQRTLKLTDKEYDELSRLAYGVLGTESDYGRSKRTLARMVVPNVVQAGLKKLNGNHDAMLNSLSQGYGSNKESSQFTIGFNKDYKEGERPGWRQVNQDVKDGKLEDYNRNTAYTYHAMNKLGVNPNNIEDAANSYKAALVQLAQYRKLNPKATPEELMARYNGTSGDKLQEYVARTNRYMSALGDDFDEANNPTRQQQLLGQASQKANVFYKKAKQARSAALGVVRDASPLPDNMDQQVHDLLGGRAPVTAETLDKSSYQKLEDMVRVAVAEGRSTLGYPDYNTSDDKNSDVNGSAVSLGTLTDPRYILKTTLGQAAIIPLGNNRYKVVDQYNFNDQGKSLGVMDDMEKRGASLYSATRALSRNYGSRPGDGSKAEIIIDLNPKKPPKGVVYKRGTARRTKG